MDTKKKSSKKHLSHKQLPLSEKSTNHQVLSVCCIFLKNKFVL
jgi:hypothetical protein